MNNQFMYYSESISKKNNKELLFNDGIRFENEDYYINDNLNNIYIVVDGISRSKEEYLFHKSFARKVSELFAHTFYDLFLNSINNISATMEIESFFKYCFVKANYSINKYISDNSKYFNDVELPGCVGVICYIRDNNIYYANFGDCIGVLFRKKQHIIFAPNKSFYIFKYLGLEHKRKILYDNYVNSPNCLYGYSVANGNENSISNFDFSYLKLEKNDVIYLSTDGLSDFIQYYQCDFINSLTLTEILDESDKQDSMLNKKYLDDKTLIRIFVK